LYLLPNGPEIGGGTAQYVTTFDGTAYENYLLARMDYHISAKNNFYGRYVYNPSSREQARPIPIWGENDHSYPHFVLMSETHVFSASSLNEIRVAFDRVDQVAPGATFAPIPNVTFVPGQPLGVITFSVGSGQMAGG
jgi:hypothetical protein